MNHNNFVFVFLFIIAVLFILPQNAEAELNIFCQEPSYIVGRDQDFTIPINISGAEDLRAFSLTISYDTDYLTAAPLDLTEGSFLADTGDPTEWYVDGTNGNYTVTCAILGVTSGGSGEGTLFSINLNAIAAASNVTVTLSSVIMRDLLNNPIYADNIEGANVKINCPIYADILLFLEGAYDAANDTMRTGLNGKIPLTSPYQDAITSPCIPDSAVDWIYVELRLTSTGTTVCGKSMFLMKSGEICDPLYDHPGFDNIGCGLYFIVIRHRNHLAILSDKKCQFKDEGTAEEIDLSLSENIFGDDAIKELGKGTCVICCGDVDGNCQVNTNDYVNWYNSFLQGETGYRAADVNFDGEVTTEDYSLWYNNFIEGAHSCGVE